MANTPQDMMNTARWSDPASASGGDPIVADVRQARDAILAEAGGTLAGLVAVLQAAERASGRELLYLPPHPSGELPGPAA